MNNFYWLTKVVLLVLACIAQTAPAQTLLRGAAPGALTGALPIHLGAKKGVRQRAVSSSLRRHGRRRHSCPR